MMATLLKLLMTLLAFKASIMLNMMIKIKILKIASHVKNSILIGYVQTDQKVFHFASKAV